MMMSEPAEVSSTSIAVDSAPPRSVDGVYGKQSRHWVGDGFPVRTLFYYGDQGEQVSPFLLLDYAGPHTFTPSAKPRGVGEHPHRGFETVTIVYEGEVAHRDSTGVGGVIGPGDVQWMTAAGGIIHDEFHSSAFGQTGGQFRMVQLWVNLPAADKMRAPRYQSILSGEIPVSELPGSAGEVGVIAGSFADRVGPAKTFSPINVWDAKLRAGGSASFDTPPGQVTMLVVLSGRVLVNGDVLVGEAEMALMSRDGFRTSVQADTDAMLLVLSGEPLGEPIVGHGPFVMNSVDEIHQAYEDFRSGRFGMIAGASDR